MKSKNILSRLFFGLLLLLSLQNVWAGQTGKITGNVIDTASGQALPSANVLLEGTTMGAVTDLEGDFVILNIQPGTYSVIATMLGYQRTSITNVKVFVDRTTQVNFKLNQTTLDLGEAVIIVAEQPMIQMDLTATAASVSADEIKKMPVESFTDILQLQAGIVEDKNGGLHIRGGRDSEIAYMIDGVSVSDPFSGKMAVGVSQESIQEMKVISGTFNAEYGKVMSGIVEVVTKEPSTNFKAGGSFYAGDYLSSNKQLFYHIDDINPIAIHNAQFYLTGTVPMSKNRLGYYLSLRQFFNEGWIYGVRRYNPTDSSNFQSPSAIYSEATGDNQAVPMNDRKQYYLNAKLVYKITPTLKLSYNFLGDQLRYHNYDHLYKYNPDGDVNYREYGYTNIVNLNHTLSAKAFYTLKLSSYFFDYQSYLYVDRNDLRYANPELLRNREDAYSFLTGGTKMTYFNRSTQVNLAKFDITAQVTKLHQIKSGFEYKYNTLKLSSHQASYNGIEGGGVFSADAYFNSGEYTHHPVEISAYVQDKIELKNMTVNVGLRYDYFNANVVVPKDLRDPSNSFNPRPNAYQDATPQHQISPRIGIAFPISATGVLHSSYGHFFQIPPFDFLYKNPRFAVAPGGLSTQMGNGNLKPQSTVIYEVGYQQELLGKIEIDITGFYKDTRNLLGTQIYETYILGDRYARYENRDYGNIRGITFALNKRASAGDPFTVSFDYSYQVSEGNASDPNHEFYNRQSNPPKKSNIQVVPLDWDQLHTINLSVSYYDPKIIGIGLIGQFQSGLPYTPAVQSQETTFENSGRKPFNYTVDLRLFKELSLWGVKYTFFIKVYNLFDRKNELDVYQDTGRAGYSLVSHYVAVRNAFVNSLDEWLNRPDYYSEPRKVLIGFDLEF